MAESVMGAHCMFFVSFDFFFLKIYLFIYYKYTVAVLRHSRRGSKKLSHFSKVALATYVPEVSVLSLIISTDLLML